MSEPMEDSDDEPSSVTAPRVYVLTAPHQCHECSKETSVHALLLQGPFQVQGEPGVSADETSALLKYATSIPAGLLDAVATASKGRWHLDRSRTYGGRYYMNHCEHCGTKIGDHFLGKPEEAYFPLTEEQAGRISGQRVDGPFLFEDPQLSFSMWMDEWLNLNA
jgi:hypothetical protein